MSHKYDKSQNYKKIDKEKLSDNKNQLSLSDVFAYNKGVNGKFSLVLICAISIIVLIYLALTYWLAVLRPIHSHENTKHALISFASSSINVDVHILIVPFIAFIIILLVLVWKISKFAQRNKIDIYDTIHFILLLTLNIMYFFVFMIPILLATYKVIEDMEFNIKLLNISFIELLLSVFPFMFVCLLLRVFKLINNITIYYYPIGIKSISHATISTLY